LRCGYIELSGPHAHRNFVVPGQRGRRPARHDHYPRSAAGGYPVERSSVSTGRHAARSRTSAVRLAAVSARPVPPQPTQVQPARGDVSGGVLPCQVLHGVPPVCLRLGCRAPIRDSVLTVPPRRPTHGARCRAPRSGRRFRSPAMAGPVRSGRPRWPVRPGPAVTSTSGHPRQPEPIRSAPALIDVRTQPFPAGGHVPDRIWAMAESVLSGACVVP
jgi:hypothetical protein